MASATKHNVLRDIAECVRRYRRAEAGGGADGRAVRVRAAPLSLASAESVAVRRPRRPDRGRLQRRLPLLRVLRDAEGARPALRQGRTPMADRELSAESDLRFQAGARLRLQKAAEEKEAQDVDVELVGGATGIVRRDDDDDRSKRCHAVLGDHVLPGL